MDYVIGFLLVLIIGVAIISGKRKKLARKQAGVNTKAQKPVISSWGYLIKTPPDSNLVCPEALKLCRKPIPVDSLMDLPKLPLPDCNQKLCRCQYQPMPERRTNSERRELDERRDTIRFEETAARRHYIDRRNYSAMWKDDRS